ncbi:ANTAR domain-containing protein [Pseudonocardiaceae bacterium YIM PH 21723]|nr:ANTAR domain-containing protein [Pseudonocardiaceae bacterium YIM PH 21723]
MWPAWRTGSSPCPRCGWPSSCSGCPADRQLIRTAAFTNEFRPIRHTTSDTGSDKGASVGGDHVGEVGTLGEQFTALTHELQEAHTVAEVLQHVVDASKAMVPDADLVSITLLGADGQLHTPVETDALATELDRLQYELHEGPCYDAADPDGPAIANCPDLRTHDLWPRWAPEAEQRGMISVLATALIPATTPGQSVGALNVYSGRPGGLDQADRNVLLLLATHASLAVSGASAFTREQLQRTQFQQAIGSRDVIGQAKGIIMARRGVSADEAFQLLREASQQLNVKLVEVARTLTTRHQELDGTAS